MFNKIINFYNDKIRTHDKIIILVRNIQNIEDKIDSSSTRLNDHLIKLIDIHKPTLSDYEGLLEKVRILNSCIEFKNEAIESANNLAGELKKDLFKFKASKCIVKVLCFLNIIE